MNLIKVKNLSVGYDKKIVLENLNFDINEKDYICIVGENGTGKSTLIKTILGLLSPIKGTIEYNISRNEIGYLPQQTSVQKDFPATVMEVVMSGFQNRCKFRPFYNKEEKQEARTNLAKLNIANLEKQCYRELSGGQQQRVLLARALCSAQKILLLDEPITGLDPLATQEMYALIKGLNQSGITIIMISHDIKCALKDASHILFATNPPFYGTKTEYEKSDLHKKYNTHHVGGHIGGHDDE
ncbi:MAG: ABC transporter ATP-binding protein [Clostridia bacterium]|nr:ABC transporter ATP-binding protein [Clostridia bacterium]